MQTRYFKFDDQPSAFSLAESEGLTGIDETGEPYLIRYTDQYAIDVIGTLYEPTGQILTDSSGNDYLEMAAIAGWHVNVRILDGTPLPASFAPYEIFPTNSTREFL